MALDPIAAAKLSREREKLLHSAMRGEFNSRLDQNYAQLDNSYDRAKADLDRRAAEGERRIGLLERGKELRAGQETLVAKTQVAEAKAREQELRAKAAGQPPPPTAPLDDAYQQVNAGASAPNPTQIPVTSIGPGGPQGVQQAKAVGGEEGGVPPWLVSGRTQTETGTRDFGAGIFMPDSATRTTTDIQQNAPSADAELRARALMERARYAEWVTASRQRAERVGQMLAAGAGDPRVRMLGEAMLSGMPSDEQRMALEYAGSFQGKEATGTARVRLQGEGDYPKLLPGYMTPPGARGFNDVPRTSVNVNNILNPDVPTLPTINDLQARAVGAVRSIDTLGQISSTFDPTFLSYRGKIKGAIGDVLSKAEVDLSPEERDFRVRYARFKSAVGSNLADTIRAATGAQMSDREWERYREFMPNESMSVEKFIGAWQQAMTTAMFAVARANYLAQGGFGDAQISKVIGQVPLNTLYDNMIPLDSVKALIDDHKGTLEEQLKIRNPGFDASQIRDQAARQTMRDFGIEKFYDQGVLTPGAR